MSLEDLILPAAVAGAGLAALAWALYLRFYVAVPPNRVLVLFGRHSVQRAADAEARGGVSSRTPRFLVGGGALLAPWNRGFAYLSLATTEVDVQVRTPAAGTRGSSSGWQMRVGVQVRIPSDEDALRNAAESLLGRTESEVRDIVRHAVEGCVPSVLARIPAELFDHDWDRLGTEIEVSLGNELVAFGLVVRSLTVKELRAYSAGDAVGAPQVSVTAPSERLLPTSADMVERFRRLEARLEGIERALGILDVELDRLSNASPSILAEEASPTAFGAKGESDDSPVQGETSSNPSLGAGRGASYDSMAGDSPGPSTPVSRPDRSVPDEAASSWNAKVSRG